MSGRSATRHYITCGIELEFVAVIKKQLLCDSNESRGITRDATESNLTSYMREYVANMLSFGGSNPYDQAHVPAIPPIAWRDVTLGAVHATEPKEADYRYWSICDDGSIGACRSDILKYLNVSHTLDKKASFDNDYWYSGAELVSSVLSLDNWSHWSLQLERVCRMLHDGTHPNFSPEGFGILGATPRGSGCGLHVHIGYGQEDVPWRVIQTVYILWAVYETEIEMLQPPERRAAANNEYALSLRTHCTPFSYKAFAKGVMTCSVPTQLIGMLVGAPESTIALALGRNLKIGISGARGNKRQTLEFREGVGSIDHEYITCWVRFIGEVIKFAQRLMDMQFDLENDLFDVGTGKPGLLLGDTIFQHLQLPAEAYGYFQNRAAIFRTMELPSDPSSFASESTNSGSLEWE